MDTTVFWGVTLCNLVENYQHFGGIYTEDRGSSSSKILVPIYQTKRRHIPEYRNFGIYRRENAQTHSFMYDYLTFKFFNEILFCE
jgi:hypothetical protein